VLFAPAAILERYQMAAAPPDPLAAPKREIAEVQGQIKALLAEKNDGKLLEAAAGTAALPKLKVAPRKVLMGHLAKVVAVHFSDDKTTLVSASSDGKLIVWDGPSTNKLAAFTLKSTWVQCTAFSGGGSFVAAGGLDNVVSVYNLRAPKDAGARAYRELQSHTGYVSALRFIGERQVLSASGDGTCILWDLETSNKLMTFSGHDADVLCLALSADTNSFISGSVDGSAKLWDVRTGRCGQTFLFDDPVQNLPGDVNAISYLGPSGNCFVTGSEDSKIRLFDIRSFAQLGSFCRADLNLSCRSLAPSPSGRLVFAAYDHMHLHAWDILKGERVAALPGHKDRISCLSMSSDGLALASSSWDQTLRVWS
jgi:guanine nucleotide-binding protein G(I)/G(S)/G(T) subunit beta-1